MKYAEYLPSKLSPQTRGFLTVDYYSNHFLAGSANLSFAASPALPLSLSSRRKLCSVDSTARLPPSSLPASLTASSFLPPCLPPTGMLLPGRRVTCGNAAQPGAAPGIPAREWDPCPGMGSLLRPERTKRSQCWLGAAVPRFERGKMKSDPALAGGVAAVALWVLEELDLGCGRRALCCDPELGWRGSLQWALSWCSCPFLSFAAALSMLQGQF